MCVCVCVCVCCVCGGVVAVELPADKHSGEVWLLSQRRDYVLNFAMWFRTISQFRTISHNASRPPNNAALM